MKRRKITVVLIDNKVTYTTIESPQPIKDIDGNNTDNSDGI
ncbi:10071_t:CDS:2 [Entrophospora sp. SA101]|nr:10071_t:CDS:2 [Entrophospora sp. SA101]